MGSGSLSYLVPRSTEEALALVSQTRPAVVAGCTDYFPSRGAGAPKGAIVDLTAIDGLRGITQDAAGWRIGATTTWTDFANAPLPAAFDGLQQAARKVGSVQIQNRATVAGNLCNASPAADGVPPLLALGAEVEIASLRGRRRVPLGAFIRGVRKVDLAADEIVVAVHVPAIAEHATSAFLKLGSRAYLVISVAMAAAVLRIEAGRIAEARVAVGACSPVAQRLPALEADLHGRAVADLAGLRVDPGRHLAPLAPIDDVRGSAAYRIEAVGELCLRAVRQAAGRRGEDG